MCSLRVSDQMEETVTAKGRSIAVCVWLVMVGIAAGQRGICRFTRDTSSLSCPCLPNAGQSLHLRSLRGPVWDICIKGNGDRLCCRNSSQAWVDAGRVKLIYSWIIHYTVYCEIGFGLSDVVCSGQGTPEQTSGQMSNLPLVNSRKPVSTRMEGWDGRKMLNSTNAAGQTVTQAGPLTQLLHAKASRPETSAPHSYNGHFRTAGLLDHNFFLLAAVSLRYNAIAINNQFANVSPLGALEVLPGLLSSSDPPLTAGGGPAAPQPPLQVTHRDIAEIVEYRTETKIRQSLSAYWTKTLY
ncbi:uncharacterized protein [Hemitrygon akajei]|uniref:uncharacterized protein n=1 Tax=Hemitrygon akajei TaxID=2704970 RepID=UPI003BF97502